MKFFVHTGAPAPASGQPIFRSFSGCRTRTFLIIMSIALYEAAQQGGSDQLRTVANIELREKVADVEFDSADRNRKTFCNFVVV